MMGGINNFGGLWSFFSFLLALSAWLVGAKIFLLPTKRIKNLNLCFYYCSDNEGDFPTRLNLIVRNLSGSNVLISSPYVHLRDRTIASELADGHSASGLYEIKFRGDTPLYSEGITLVKVGQDTESFLPLRTDLAYDDLIKVFSSHRYGDYFVCDVTILKEKIRVRRCRIPLRNIQNRDCQTAGAGDASQPA